MLGSLEDWRIGNAKKHTNNDIRETMFKLTGNWEQLTAVIALCPPLAEGVKQRGNLRQMGDDSRETINLMIGRLEGWKAGNTKKQIKVKIEIKFFLRI